MPAMITLELDQYDEMRANVARLNKENGELKAQLGEARMNESGDGGELAHKLVSTIRRALKVVQFAEGNLDPETVRGWPHSDLVALADAVIAMPVSTDQEKEWANDAKQFARVAEIIERARARGVHGQLAGIQRPSVDGQSYAQAAEAIIDKGAP